MLGPFELFLTKPAQKYYQKLARDTARRLDRAFLILEKDPFRLDVEPLVGFPGRFRLRIGDLRVILKIDHAKRKIFVVAIVPRGQAYRK